MDVRDQIVIEEDGWVLHEIGLLPNYPADDKLPLQFIRLELELPSRNIKDIPNYWCRVVLKESGLILCDATLKRVLRSDYCPQNIKNAIYMYTL